MSNEYFTVLLTLSCLLMGCKNGALNDRYEDLNSQHFISASSDTTTTELKYLEWLYINHISPDLLMPDGCKNQSHFYVYVELSPHIEQALRKHGGFSEAIKYDVAQNHIRGYALVNTETTMKLRHISSGSIWKATSESVIVRNDYHPDVWAGEVSFDSFEAVVRASAATDKLLKSVAGKKERDGKGWGWTELQSYLLVGGYLDSMRCIYVTPNPYTRKEPYYTDISTVEENAIDVMNNGDRHFTSWHAE